MKSSVETLEGNKVKVYVEVDETEFETDIDQAFRTIAREVKLPGFRNGKVPRKVLEARVGVAAAREQALRDAIPNYLSQAVAEHDVDIIATPEVEITGGEESGLVEFEAEVEVRPTVEVDGYADITVEVESIEPTAEEIADAQAAELKNHGTLTDTDAPAAEGDFLTLDLAATRGDEEVMGLNTEDWSYELGQGWVTDDFDEHITGASVGDVVEFTATPKGTEEPADFKVTVKAIQNLEIPELTDEWVAENTGEFETIEEWNESLTAELAEERLNNARRVVGPKISEAIAELVEIDPPDALVQAEMQQQVQNLARQLQQQGIDFEQWFQMTGQDPNEFMEGTRPQAELAVKADLALRAVAAAENLETTDHDVEQEYARMAMMYGQKASDIRKIYDENRAEPELRSQIRKQKAMDWLVHNVTIVDVDGNTVDRDKLLGHSHDEHDEAAGETGETVVPDYEVVFPEDEESAESNDESDES